jgi:hypothetical protein
MIAAWVRRRSILPGTLAPGVALDGSAGGGFLFSARRYCGGWALADEAEALILVLVLVYIYFMLENTDIFTPKDSRGPWYLRVYSSARLGLFK